MQQGPGINPIINVVYFPTKRHMKPNRVTSLHVFHKAITYFLLHDCLEILSFCSKEHKKATYIKNVIGLPSISACLRRNLLQSLSLSTLRFFGCLVKGPTLHKNNYEVDHLHLDHKHEINLRNFITHLSVVNDVEQDQGDKAAGNVGHHEDHHPLPTPQWDFSLTGNREYACHYMSGMQIVDHFYLTWTLCLKSIQ